MSMLRKTFLLCTNRGTYEATKVCLHSLLKHNPDSTVYIFSKDLEVDAFSGKPVRHIQVDSNVDAGAYGMGHYKEGTSDGMVLRLWALDYLKMNSSVERVVYIDVDTIINGDLREMFEIPFGPDIWLAAAREHSDVDPIAQKIYPLVDDNYGIRKKKCKVYFNSGVLVVDLNKMPKGIYQYYLDHARFYKFPDQDCLNELVKDKYLIMPQTYNAMPDFYLWKFKEPAQLISWRRNVKTSKIIHYAGGHKPFMEVANSSRYFLCVPYELYYEYALEIKDDIHPDIWEIIQANMDKAKYMAMFGDFITEMTKHRMKYIKKA